MIWVTYRQHRWAIIGTAVAVLGLWLAGWTSEHVQRDLPYSYFGTIVAVFWGAPLLSGEYEGRTHVFAWTQDISPTRWLLEKVAVLALASAVLAVVLGALARLSAPSPDPWTVFEESAVLQVGYAWLGLALGLACSALARRTVVAMGLSLFAFQLVRVVLARWGREHYLPPVHTWRPDPPRGVEYQRQLPVDGLWVDSGYADKNGDPMPPPLHCNGDDACLEANGQVGHYVDYQPGSRFVLFQMIEFGICVLLAAVLLAVALATLRRAVRPAVMRR